MSGWTWDLNAHPDGPGVEATVEHDGRVYITLADEDTDNGRTAIVDPDDFEAMARSYLERMAEWRARTSGSGS